MPVFTKGPDDYELIVNRFSSDADFEKKPWVEIEHQLPKPPAEENLVPIDINSLSRKPFFVDELSVTYGADEAIRYTLVVMVLRGAGERQL